MSQDAWKGTGDRCQQHSRNINVLFLCKEMSVLYKECIIKITFIEAGMEKKLSDGVKRAKRWIEFRETIWSTCQEGHVSLSLSCYPLAQSSISARDPLDCYPRCVGGQRSHRVTSPYKHSTYHHGTRAAPLDDRLMQRVTPAPTTQPHKHNEGWSCVCVGGCVWDIKICF